MFVGFEVHEITSWKCSDLLVVLFLRRCSWIHGYKIRHRKGCSPNITSKDLQEIEETIHDFLRLFKEKFAKHLPSGK
jgi:hypothetical protein